jgi:ketosteroid isomerase-like protein
MALSNKEIIRKVNDGFMADDVEAILGYVAEDVRWDVQGAFTALGKDEFRNAIHNGHFEPGPVITTLHEIEEDGYVSVEGTVSSKMKNGKLFEAYFHNAYRMENGKIKEMRSYLVPKS